MKNFRQKMIVEKLRRDKVVNTIAMSEEFDVSIETIRRDLDYLEKQGILRKIYGGAESVNDPDIMPAPLDQRRDEFHDIKVRLARQAAEYIPGHCTVAMDAGSTIFELCPFLKDKEDLTIIASDIHTASEMLSTGHKIYIMGGFLTQDGTSSGTFAKEFFSNVAGIDYFVCSTDGAHPDEGFSNDEKGINELKLRYLKKARTKIAMFDHSKIQKRCFYRMCGFEEFDMIITDSETPPEAIDKFIRMGIDVKIV